MGATKSSPKLPEVIKKEKWADTRTRIKVRRLALPCRQRAGRPGLPPHQLLPPDCSRTLVHHFGTAPRDPDQLVAPGIGPAPHPRPHPPSPRPPHHATLPHPLQVGSGRAAFQRAKQLVGSWGHFQLGWADVDPATPIKQGAPVCMRTNTFGIWTMNPLEVL